MNPLTKNEPTFSHCKKKPPLSTTTNYATPFVTTLSNNTVYDGYQATYQALLQNHLQETVTPLVTSTMQALGYSENDIHTDVRIISSYPIQAGSPAPLEDVLPTLKYNAVITLPVYVTSQEELNTATTALQKEFEQNSVPLNTIVFVAYEQDTKGFAYYTRVYQNNAFVPTTTANYFSNTQFSYLHAFPSDLIQNLGNTLPNIVTDSSYIYPLS